MNSTTTGEVGGAHGRSLGRSRLAVDDWWMATDIQKRRARQYAVCSYALTQDRITDGAEGVFDQALTNGLAAIVAAEWPGEEFERSLHVRSASSLLKIVEQKGATGAKGVMHVLRAGEPQWLPPPGFGEEPTPNFTIVEVGTLRDALKVTWAIRHARDEDQEAVVGVSEEHINALVELARHPALYSMPDVAADRAEDRLHDADDIELRRAAAYYSALDDAEQGRREAVDYEDRYGYVAPDGRCEVEECPVCGNLSLAADRFDGWLDELGIGTCIVCSYSRHPDLADELATGRMLERHEHD